MAASFDPHDPRQLTSRQRLDTLAAVLAIGATRMLALRAPRAVAPSEPPEDSSQNRLDVPAESRLHVPRG